MGYKDSNTSYPEELVKWMQTAFPRVTFNLTNLARRATAATFGALCMVKVGILLGILLGWHDWGK